MKNSIVAWLKRNWVSIALAVGILILLLLLFQSNGTINNQKEQYKAVQAEVAASKQREIEANLKATRIANDRDSVAKSKDTLAVELAQVKTELRKALNTTVSLSDQVRAAKLLKDTARYVIACDSLAEENKSLADQVGEYMVKTEALTSMLEENERRADSIIQVKDEFNAALRGSVKMVDSSYNNLFNEYSKQSKKLKWEKTKTKGAAAIGIILTILALVK